MGTKIYSFSLMILFSLNIFGQVYDHNHSLCGTSTLGEKQEAWLSSFQQRPTYQKMQYGGSRAEKTIPLAIHIVGDDSGKGYYDLEDLFHTMCVLNDNYVQADMYFYIKGDIEYIDNTEYYDHDYSAGRDMMYTHNVDGAINVYFCNQAVEGNCGYFDWTGDAVAITNSCQLREATTLTHELGHFLSLPHTFSGWEGRSIDENPVNENRQERQDGANCSWAGDGFCDTPPDYHSDRWNCPYTFGYLDPVGDSIETDGSLFMSYSNDGCQSKFSEEQIQAMHANVEENRYYLLNSDAPEFVEFEEPNLVYPVANSYDVPENYVVFGWDPIEGAEMYHIQVTTQFGSFAALMIDEVVSNNYMVNTTDFLYDKSYKYRVRAIAGMNTCTEFSEEREFTINAPTYAPDTTWNIWLEEDDETGIEALEVGDLNVYPNPTNGSDEIIIISDFNLGETAEITFTDITGRKVFNESRILTSSSTAIAINELKSGIYFVSMETEYKRRSNKLIIQ